MRNPSMFSESQSRFLREFGNDVEQQFATARDFLGLKYLHVAPTKTFSGMVVNATAGLLGVNEGMYRRDEANAAWVFVG